MRGQGLRLAICRSSTYNRLMNCEALVIGSGLAGLALSLRLADLGHQVLLTTKTQLSETNSSMAQGGIASVLSGQDSFESHVNDTLVAGAGLCHRDVVEKIVSEGPAQIRQLLDWGVEFDLDTDSQLALTREGGHSERRIVHIADHTGMAIHQQLSRKVLNHPRIQILENHFAVDLVTTRQTRPTELKPNRCLGAYLFDKHTRQVFPVRAKSTFLACGGAGKVYLYTSNWSGATGDGVAMAARAGARIANLEFTQFHPTCLYHPNSRNFLISEALRGEGAELVDAQGEAFMKKYHPLGSLAPRDIVARSIDGEMKKKGLDCVYLDLTFKSKEEIEKRFPQIYNRCKSLGISIDKEPIPVVPAAHYLCGGIVADVSGHTDLEALYAIGENACTGLHGANRLASNSLLECLVMADKAAVDFHQNALEDFAVEEIPPWVANESGNDDELIVVSHMWDEIRRLMWNYMGIVRTTRRLERAHHRLELIEQEIKEYYSSFQTHPDIEELRNICLVALMSVRCALGRKESRGIHYSLDYPVSLEEAKDSVISLGN